MWTYNFQVRHVTPISPGWYEAPPLVMTPSRPTLCFILQHESISALCCLCPWHSGARGVNPITQPPLQASAATAHAWRIYFITGSRSATPRWPCNHLVCFHIHSYEAVICPALCEAGGCPLSSSVPGAPLACVAPHCLQREDIYSCCDTSAWK